MKVLHYSRGYKSKCWDKDVPAIIKCAEEKGYSADLLKEVVRSNKKFIGETNEK